MLIQGPHGVDAGRALSAKDKIFGQVEVGQTAAIAAKSLMVWSDVDNTNQPNIYADTRGLRVIICPTAAATDGTVRQAGFLVKAYVANAAALTERNPIVLIQQYGYFQGFRTQTTTNGNILANGALIPSADLAGAVSGFEAEAAPTNMEPVKLVGFAWTAVSANESAEGSVDGFIRGII